MRAAFDTDNSSHPQTTLNKAALIFKDTLLTSTVYGNSVWNALMSETERAGRHYQSVEPENRLVARQLAREWEEKLATKQQLQEDYQRFLHKQSRLLSAEEREMIRQVAQNIPALWQAATTTERERKELIRQVIARGKRQR